MSNPELPTTFARQLRELERRIRDLETAARLPSSSIGSGGLTVLDGGGITVEGGSVTVLEGGGIIIEGGGDLVMTGGGEIELDGVPLSDLAARHESYYDFSAKTTPATATRGSYQPVFEPPVLDAPSWADGAVVVCTAVLVIPNPSSTGWFDGIVNINGNSGEALGWQYNGDTAQCAVTFGRKLTDLTGGVDVSVLVSNISTGDDLEVNLTTTVGFLSDAGSQTQGLAG